jgi:hypothetical protein
MSNIMLPAQIPYVLLNHIRNSINERLVTRDQLAWLHNALYYIELDTIPKGGYAELVKNKPVGVCILVAANNFSFVLLFVVNKRSTDLFKLWFCHPG